MMSDNEGLPQIERLSRHEFDLDVEEQKQLQAQCEVEVQKVIIVSHDLLNTAPVTVLGFCLTRSARLGLPSGPNETICNVLLHVILYWQCRRIRRQGVTLHLQF